MTSNKSAPEFFSFHGWELRPRERLLVVAGRPVQVGGRAFEVLLALVARQGKIASKTELMDAAWPSMNVEENNISVQIAGLRKLLGADAIATIPGRGYQLSAKPLPPETGRASAGADVLTEYTPELIGRQKDLAEVLDALTEAVVLTLVGTGGVGKTALARETFSRHCARRQSAGHWIDLAPIQDARHMVPLIAKSLDIELQDTAQDAAALATALGNAAGFVVLDNCEHLTAELGRFMRLAVRDASRMRWLCTSQEPLHVPGEAVYRLAPLEVPEGCTSPAQALEYGAVALLCKRVAEADQAFRLDASSLPAAIALCEQLDGLPLAIEMAAARVATLGLEQVRRHLDRQLRLASTGPRAAGYRHATLQAMYEWSHGLLPAREQTVFRRLEPFLGGFQLDIALAVASDAEETGPIDSTEVLDAIHELIHKSMVQRDSDDHGRFHLLESARDHARTRLRNAGEVEAVRRRHACAVAAWFASAQADADRMTDAEWLKRYSPERHNARAALAWACEAKAADELAQLVTGLTLLDWFLCRQAEILQFDVPLEGLALAAPRLRAAAYLELSWAHYSDGDHELGARLAREAHEIFVSLGETALAYRALAQLTRLYESRPGTAGLAQAAWECLERLDDRGVPLRTRLFCASSAGLMLRPSLTIDRVRDLARLAEEAGFDAIAAIGGCNLTELMLAAGQYAEAIEVADRLLRSAGHLPRASAFILHNKATALVRVGRIEDAYAPAQLAFQAMPGVAHFLVDTFALAAVREGRLADAAVLHGCGQQIRAELDESPDRSEAAAIAETAVALSTGMGTAQRMELMAFGAAMRAGEALTIKVFARRHLARTRDVPREGEAGPASLRDVEPANP